MKDSKGSRNIYEKLKNEFSFKSYVKNEEEASNNNNTEKDAKNTYEVINKKAEELTNWLLNDYLMDK